MAAAPAGVTCALRRWADARVELLTYGRAPDDTPVPAGASSLGTVPADPRGALSLLLRLRRTRYAAAIVAQPGLARSRARGALVGFAAAVGARRLLALDPLAPDAVPFTVPQAAADAARFALGSAASTVIASALARIIERVPAAPARPLPIEGRVAYLRTDLDVALAPLTAGGSLAHTDGVITALRRRGHEVEVLSTGEMTGIPAEPLPALARPNLPWEIAELLSGLAQATTAARRDVSLFYQRYSANNLAGVIAAGVRRVPLVLEANASEVTWRAEWSSLTYPRLARATERAVLARSDRIATISENAARDLIPAGADPARLRVIPNGVDPERFRVDSPTELPFGPGSFVIAFCGLFYPWHGVRFLAEAFGAARRRLPDARLLLVGDGEERAAAEAILEQAGFAGDALLTGLVPAREVPRYLAAADVLASPHVRNDEFIGSPIKLWEYMAAGRAIIASRVAQVGEAIDHGRTGLVAEPEDVDSWVGALVQLHDDPTLRERLGRAAREEAVRKHSWDARMTALLDD